MNTRLLVGGVLRRANLEDSGGRKWVGREDGEER